MSIYKNDYISLHENPVAENEALFIKMSTIKYERKNNIQCILWYHGLTLNQTVEYTFIFFCMTKWSRVTLCHHNDKILWQHPIAFCVGNLSNSMYDQRMTNAKKGYFHFSSMLHSIWPVCQKGHSEPRVVMMSTLSPWLHRRLSHIFGATSDAKLGIMTFLDVECMFWRRLRVRTAISFQFTWLTTYNWFQGYNSVCFSLQFMYVLWSL